MRDDDETATDGGGAVAERGREPPVSDWDRYKNLQYLGCGGMGKVFKAFDPRLDRHVALKFIRDDDPQLIRRFTQEARTQARVDHDRVCKIYEVGDVEGHPYIAMQLIYGMPLDGAADSMTLEQKLLVMKEVAEGLHEAHRNGLIHRDIKPSNVMVERSQDGRLRPYIMDFGLARDQASAGMTITGAVIGTPYFMPPEQAMGRIHDLDRRSDVYQLGATLYAVLSGRPPFQGESHTEVLRQVVEDPAEPLARGDSAIPADVDAIVMKCLRKAPDERYPSARALAEDLGRYLDGYPIEARQTTVFYRLKLRAAKHKMAVAVGSVALVLLAVVALWGGYNAWNAARRVRLAQSFGRQIERIEALMRYSHTIPLHDVRPDRARVRQLMDDIEEQMASVGQIGLGPGHYALGRGYMSTNSWGDARTHLEAAWDADYREPEVALALGRVIGAQYDEALRETTQIKSQDLREAHRNQIETDYLEPAVRYLRNGQGAEMDSPEFVSALLAFYEKRYDDALELTREAYRNTPWMYEARSLEGNVHEALAIELIDRGEYDSGLESYERALESHEAAAAVGESDPAVHVNLCALDRAIMVMELLGTARDITPYFERGVSQCDRALEAAPGNPDALLELASLHDRMGEYLRVKQKDPRSHYERSIDFAKQVSQVRADPRAHGITASALRGIGSFEQERGNDPREYLTRAVEAYEESIALEPDDLVYNNLGLVYKNLARYEQNRGHDPRDSLRKAINAFGESLERNPDQVAALTNQGTSYYDLAVWEMRRGEDPLPSFERAVGALRGAEKINPKQVAVLYNLGRAYTDQAYYVRGRGEDPRELLRTAADAYARAIEVNPESAYVPYFFSGMGAALDGLAHYEWKTGRDPTGSIREGLEAYRNAVSANPDYVYGHGNMGILHTFEAACALERGEDPRESVRDAIEASRGALKLKPDHHDAYDNIAHAYFIRGLFELENGIDVEASIAAGRNAVAKSREINPNSVYAVYALGRLLTLEGRWHWGRGRDPSASFDSAEALFEEAIRLDPDDAGTYEAFADLHRWRAEQIASRSGSPQEEVNRGLERVEKSLSINPASADALGLRGILQLLKAELEDAPGLKGPLLEQARESLDQALALNSNLSRTLEPPLSKVQLLLSQITR